MRPKLYAYEKELRFIQYNREQADTILKNSETDLQAALEGMAEQIGDRQKELANIEIKIEKLEEKMMKDEIESSTYKKWFNKYAREKT